MLSFHRRWRRPRLSAVLIAVIATVTCLMAARLSLTTLLLSGQYAGGVLLSAFQQLHSATDVSRHHAQKEKQVLTSIEPAMTKTNRGEIADVVLPCALDGYSSRRAPSWTMSADVINGLHGATATPCGHRRRRQNTPTLSFKLQGLERVVHHHVC